MISSFSVNAIHVGRAIFKRVAQDQGGLLTGKDPTVVNTADPLRLWVIQLSIILLTAQLLSIPLAKIHQPKVLAEIIGGIILGPSIMGRVPGFTSHIFPAASKPALTLVAQIGLILYLFIMGLEIDAPTVKRNLRRSMTISLGALLIPFGLGSVISVLLYRHFIEPEGTGVSFPHFLLFVGVALSITAFPVLCRILTALKLLDTNVGVVVLTAGVTNDVIGWVLLALAVTLVNAGSGLTALWILMVCAGFIVLLMWPGRWAMYWLAKKTGSLENGPSPFYITATVLVSFGCAFFTDIIGVNAIFGGFLGGLIIPREGGLAIAITEKLEDMVVFIFLPTYFTLSGLSTDLGTLNTGAAWGFLVLLMLFDYSGKLFGGSMGARIAGFKWRESAAIGQLMSCKGLTELVVLNVGLGAGILNTRVFSMFVLDAVLLTLLTTPMVLLIYPARIRTKARGITGKESEEAIGEKSDPSAESPSDRDDAEIILKKRFTYVLDKMEHLPAFMSLTQLLQQPPSYSPPAASTSVVPRAPKSISLDLLRLIELSSRTSDVMKSSAIPELLLTDPLLNVFTTFASEIQGVPVSSELKIVEMNEMAYAVSESARKGGSQMIVVSRVIPFSPSTEDTPRLTITNPFEALFRTAANSTNAEPMSALSTDFIRRVFAESSTDVAFYLDRSLPSGTRGGSSGKHIIFPFFGGPDDRVALAFVVQLCCHPGVTATVVRMNSTSAETDTPVEKMEKAHLAGSNKADEALDGLKSGLPTYQDTIYPSATTQFRLASETADNLAWARFTSSQFPISSQSDLLIQSALTRVSFEVQSTSKPLHTIIQVVAEKEREGKKVKVVVGRARRMAVENHRRELTEIISASSGDGNWNGADEVRKTIGDVGAAVIACGSKSPIVVIQAASVSEK